MLQTVFDISLPSPLSDYLDTLTAYIINLRTKLPENFHRYWTISESKLLTIVQHFLIMDREDLVVPVILSSLEDRITNEFYRYPIGRTIYRIVSGLELFTQRGYLSEFSKIPLKNCYGIKGESVEYLLFVNGMPDCPAYGEYHVSIPEFWQMLFNFLFGISHLYGFGRETVIDRPDVPNDIYYPVLMFNVELLKCLKEGKLSALDLSFSSKDIEIFRKIREVVVSELLEDLTILKVMGGGDSWLEIVLECFRQ